jgi:hypothetical protein
MRTRWMGVLVVVALAGCAAREVDRTDDQAWDACHYLMHGPYADFADCIRQEGPKSGNSWLQRVTSIIAGGVQTGEFSRTQAYRLTFAKMISREEAAAESVGGGAGWDGLIAGGAYMLAPRPPMVTCVTNPSGSLTACH